VNNKQNFFLGVCVYSFFSSLDTKKSAGHGTCLGGNAESVSGRNLLVGNQAFLGQFSMSGPRLVVVIVIARVHGDVRVALCLTTETKELLFTKGNVGQAEVVVNVIVVMIAGKHHLDPLQHESGHRMVNHGLVQINVWPVQQDVQIHEEAAEFTGRPGDLTFTLLSLILQKEVQPDLKYMEISTLLQGLGRHRNDRSSRMRSELCQNGLLDDFQQDGGHLSDGRREVGGQSAKRHCFFSERTRKKERDDCCLL